MDYSSGGRKSAQRFLIVFLIAVCFTVTALFSGCKDNEGDQLDMNDINSNPVATMTVRSQTGEILIIRIELYPDKAPLTVSNFTELANSGFYDGLHFHRIVPGGCLQGGAYSFAQTENGFTLSEPDRDVTEIKGEFASNGHPENDIRHTKGTISMARTSDPDSATSQFFICVDDYPSWDGEYAAFGMATDEESLAALDKLADSSYINAGYAFRTLPYPLISIVSVRVDDASSATP